MRFLDIFNASVEPASPQLPQTTAATRKLQQQYAEQFATYNERCRVRIAEIRKSKNDPYWTPYTWRALGEDFQPPVNPFSGVRL